MKEGAVKIGCIVFLILAGFCMGCAPAEDVGKEEDAVEAVMAEAVFTSLPQEYQEAFRRVLWGEYSLIEGVGEDSFSFIEDAQTLREGRYMYVDITYDGLEECIITTEEQCGAHYYFLQYREDGIEIINEVCMGDYRKIQLWNHGILILEDKDGKRYKGAWDFAKGEYEIEEVEMDDDTWNTWFGRSDFLRWKAVSSVYGTDFDTYFLNYQWDNQVAGNNGLTYYSNAENQFYLYRKNSRGETSWVYAEPVRSIYLQNSWIYFTQRGEKNRLCRIKKYINSDESAECLTDFSVVSLLKVGERFCFLSDDAPDIEHPQKNQFFLYSMNLDGSDVLRLLEEPCLSYESDGTLLYATLETENGTRIKQLDPFGVVQNPDCKTGLIWAKRPDFIQVDGQLLDDEKDFPLVMGMYTLDNLSAEEMEAYQELFSGNYSRLEGAGEEASIFVEYADTLWNGKCILLDVDGDGRQECCLKVRGSDYWSNNIYVLQYQNGTGTIKVLDTYEYSSMDQSFKFQVECMPFRDSGISHSTMEKWQPVFSFLTEDYKTYFMNFAWDNPVGNRGEQLFYSNPGAGYQIYAATMEDLIGEVAIKMPARSIYVEKDGIYFTNCADGNKLYYGRTDGSGEICCLTEFPVKKLLKIKEHFYFLTVREADGQGWRLYSMRTDGTDIKCLSKDVCETYWSDGNYLFCTFRENENEWQEELDLQGKKIADGFPDMPVMAERGNLYMTGIGLLDPDLEQRYLFFAKHPDWEYEIREEIKAEGKTLAGDAYSIRMPQFDNQLQGAEKINKRLAEQLAEYAEKIERSAEKGTSIKIGYNWYYTSPYWLSICFYEESKGENSYDFLKPITFQAETGKELGIEEMFRVPEDECEEFLLKGIERNEDISQEAAKEALNGWQGDFYIGAKGIVLCLEPDPLTGQENWGEKVLPYDYWYFSEQLVNVHRDRVNVLDWDVVQEEMGEAGDPGNELRFQVRVRYNDTYAPGIGLLNKEEYFVRPLILGDSNAVDRMNQTLSYAEEEYFQEVRDPEGWNLSRYCYGANPPYYHTRDAYVYYNKNGLFSVNINYDWWAGGVLDYGWDTYNFYTDTGERFYLGDVFLEDADTLRKKIYDIFDEDYEWVSDALLDYDLKDFDFVFEETELVIFFDKYEVGCGADGAQIVRIPYSELHFRENFPLSRTQNQEE